MVLPPAKELIIAASACQLLPNRKYSKASEHTSCFVRNFFASTKDDACKTPRSVEGCP